MPCLPPTPLSLLSPKEGKVTLRVSPPLLPASIIPDRTAEKQAAGELCSSSEEDTSQETAVSWFLQADKLGENSADHNGDPPPMLDCTC